MAGPARVDIIDVLRRVPVLLVEEHDMVVRLQDAVAGGVLVVEASADVVVADGDNLAGVGLEEVGSAGADEAGDLLAGEGERRRRSEGKLVEIQRGNRSRWGRRQRRGRRRSRRGERESARAPFFL